LSQSETEFEAYTELSNPEVTEDGFVIIIDTSLEKVYSFSIYSFNQYGNSALSEMLTITVSDAIINEDENEDDGMNWEPVFTSDLSDQEIQLYSTI
jgi:SPX domain protein involved in polyphosphate accumulation